MKVQIELPVYLVKFLQTIYGDEYRLNNKEELGIMVLNSLLRKTDPYYQFKKLVYGRPGIYTFIISDQDYEMRGCELGEADQIMICRVIDRWFRNNLYRTAVVNQQRFGIPVKKTIINYLDVYGVSEDDLPYSTIRKDFNRKKKRIQIQLK